VDNLILDTIPAVNLEDLPHEWQNLRQPGETVVYPPTVIRIKFTLDELEDIKFTRTEHGKRYRDDCWNYSEYGHVIGRCKKPYDGSGLDHEIMNAEIRAHPERYTGIVSGNRDWWLDTWKISSC
jgi:hypothetical protein